MDGPVYGYRTGGGLTARSSKFMAERRVLLPRHGGADPIQEPMNRSGSGSSHSGALDCINIVLELSLRSSTSGFGNPDREVQDAFPTAERTNAMSVSPYSRAMNSLQLSIP
ncbi:hypothetical protein E4U61_001931 [Claviceps capensis]|nr:hypothetical protein E4U61_001931 [Claviceps capensis]